MRSAGTLSAVTALAALVLQAAVVSQLPLPGAVQPDLVLLSVVALALVTGPLPGLVTGFCVGLAADVIPPADHAIGRYALVYCVIGYACGLLSDSLDRSPVLPFVTVAGGVFSGSVLYAAVGMGLGDPRASWEVVSSVLPLTVLYEMLLSPFAVWLVLRLARRAERARASDRHLAALPAIDRTSWQ